jgi:hypothetical protein
MTTRPSGFLLTFTNCAGFRSCRTARKSRCRQFNSAPRHHFNPSSDCQGRSVARQTPRFFVRPRPLWRWPLHKPRTRRSPSVRAIMLHRSGASGFRRVRGRGASSTSYRIADVTASSARVYFVLAAAIEYWPTTSNTAPPVASNVPAQVPFPVRPRNLPVPP